ncbi:hypothetical protein MBLNU459_g3716t1 [Dothideomycetes sp. NU459]
MAWFAQHNAGPVGRTSDQQPWKRTFFTGVSPFLLAPAVFAGLVLAHWFQKCILMVLFQNKIIYMPSLPPGSRREVLGNYAKMWGPVAWREQHIKSSDGTDLALCIGQLERDEAANQQSATKRGPRQALLLYFQGNGASLPPRTPMLSNVLRAVDHDSPQQWILVALSYRGYWTSSGRAHQRGIEKDAEALLDWVVNTYSDPSSGSVDLVLWGQSIGAGVASHAAVRYLEKYDARAPPNGAHGLPRLSRLILETPFVSIKSMLAALYPDWWVPYRHLWPFLRSWWDNEDALRRIANAKEPPKILLVVAARDEVVPRVQADQLGRLCGDLKLGVQRKDVLGALHTQASSLQEGQRIISKFLKETS